MSITNSDYQIPDNSHDNYDVDFYSDGIYTTVTHDPEIVVDWISAIESIHNRRLHRLIVGLDIEWRPSFNRYQQNPVATLQLCVGRRCLIFQIFQCVHNYQDEIPDELFQFLGNEEYTFVGVGIVNDLEKLEADYELEVGGKIVDLRGLAAEAYQMNRLNGVGLKELTRVVLGREIEKSMSVTLGRWDNQWLNLDQVTYACLDAFVSFEIGKRLHASDSNLRRRRPLAAGVLPFLLLIFVIPLLISLSL